MKLIPVEKGPFCSGNRIKPIRDLVEFENRIISSEWEERFPQKGICYLIEESYEYIPKDFFGSTPEEEFERRQRWLYWAQPAFTGYKIKLFGFTMKPDKHGFETFFKDKYFVDKDYVLL